MKKQLLILSAVTVAIPVFILAGCTSKPKLENNNEHPAVEVPTQQKAEEEAPAMEHPDSSKPKDHPAH